jgi:hypothetical protein
MLTYLTSWFSKNSFNFWVGMASSWKNYTPVQLFLTARWGENKKAAKSYLRGHSFFSGTRSTKELLLSLPLSGFSCRSSRSGFPFLSSPVVLAGSRKPIHLQLKYHSVVFLSMRIDAASIP